MSEDISSKVKKIVADHLGIDEAKVTDESSFIDDLGADSLDTVELVMAFEEEFGSEISDNEAEKILTVGEAAYRAEKIPILKGMLLYSVAAILSFIFLKNHKYIVEFDESTIEEELLILAGAASQFTGGGMHIAPDALKVKEMVNLLYSRKVNRFQAFNLLLGVFSGSHLKHSKVINIHTARLLVSTQSDSPWAPLVYGDGEYLGDLPVEISLGKKPLQVLVPK